MTPKRNRSSATKNQPVVVSFIPHTKVEQALYGVLEVKRCVPSGTNLTPIEFSRIPVQSYVLLLHSSFVFKPVE